MQQFSSSDINEAKRRVREMQERARSYSGIDSDSAPEEEPTEKPTEKAPENENGGNAFGIFDFLSSLTSGEDGSKGIILALILILSREKADNILILALLYILL